MAALGPIPLGCREQQGPPERTHIAKGTVGEQLFIHRDNDYHTPHPTPPPQTSRWCGKGPNSVRERSEGLCEGNFLLPGNVESQPASLLACLFTFQNVVRPIRVLRTVAAAAAVNVAMLPRKPIET